MPPPPQPSQSTGVIIGASVGAGAASAFLLAACTWWAVRRRQRQSQSQPGPGKLASSRKGHWPGDESIKEATPKQHRALAAQDTASVPLPKPGAHWKAAGFSVSEHLDSWRSPWERQEPEQPAAVDSAKSRHSQSGTSSASFPKGDRAGPGRRCDPADGHLSSWESFPKVRLRSIMRCFAARHHIASCAAQGADLGVPCSPESAGRCD